MSFSALSKIFLALVLLSVFPCAYGQNWTDYAVKDPGKLSANLLQIDQVEDKIYMKWNVLNNLESKDAEFHFGYSNKLDFLEENLSFAAHECTIAVRENVNLTWCRIPVVASPQQEVELWFRANSYGSDKMKVWVEVPAQEAYAKYDVPLKITEEKGKVSYSSVSMFAFLVMALGAVIWLAVFFADTSPKADEKASRAVFLLQKFAAPLGILSNLVFGFGFMFFVSPEPSVQSFALLAVAFAAGYFLLVSQIKAQKAVAEEHQMTVEELMQKRTEAEERVKRVKAEFMTGRVSGETYKQITTEAEHELVDLDIKIQAKRQSTAAVSAPMLPEESFGFSALPSLLSQPTSILVEGPTESKKADFSFQSLRPFLDSGKRIAVFSLKEQDFLFDRLKASASSEQASVISFLKLDTDPTSIGIDVSSHSKSVGFDAASFDILSGMLVKEPTDRVLKFLEFNLDRFKKDGKTLVFLVDNESASKQALAALEQSFDAVVEFKVVEAGSQAADCVKIKRFPNYSKEPKWLLYKPQEAAPQGGQNAPASQGADSTTGQ